MNYDYVMSNIVHQKWGNARKRNTLRKRIMTMTSPGMALRKPAYSEPKAFDRTVFFKSVYAIL